MALEHGTIDINARNILPIIKKWLYSDKDIFVRELVSNAADAITKHKTLAASGECAAEDDYRITIQVDKENCQLRFIDNGIGMTADEVRRYINQVAFSGAQEFIQQYQQAEGGIIGHFGLGFYSSFMVSKQVEIDTLSFAEGATAVKWRSEDGMDFDMEEGTRTSRGTCITLTLADDEKEFLTPGRVHDVLTTYCRFMPIPIFLETGEKDAQPQLITNLEPLWLKHPRECTDEEYREFYKQTFAQWEDPLFYIHLWLDYPLNLKGILYFPRLRDDQQANEGQVKLFCNQVFVADNIKEIIPEFLLLLRGVVDCPDLPLNVSRSFLQNDGAVKTLSSHITKKVADRLETLYTEGREEYEKCWADISPFIKYGCMRDDKFYSRMASMLLLRTTSGEFLSVEQALEAAKEKHEGRLVYTTDSQLQAVPVNMLTSQNINVFIMDTPMDGPFMNFLEMKRENLRFLRVDADLSELYSKEGASDEALAKTAEALFRAASGDETLVVTLQPLKDQSIPAMLVLDEYMRRFADMDRLYGQKLPEGFPIKQTLLLNPEHPAVARLLALPTAATPSDPALTAARQLFDLCSLSHQRLSPERMADFIARSYAYIEESLDED